jgi:glycosyltransferase involved in cell wall biosynthesis
LDTDIEQLRRLRVAIVHERFTEYAGSERCVEQFHELWPDATIHAAVVHRDVLPPSLAEADIRATSLQRLYRGGRGYAHLLPLLPAAMSRIDVGDVDVVVTSHHSFSNRVRVPPGTPIVSYTHTPARWMWEKGMLANEPGGAPGRVALRSFAALQRGADRRAAQRLAGVVANSAHVAQRIRRWWGREAEVVHPPVDVDFFTPDPSVTREDFFLLAGRLVPYKRPEVAVAAAATAGVRLVVAGDGRARRAVEAAAGPRTEIIGAVDDETLRDLFRRCRALVFPGEEDFGIVPVEAQACGAPVIARAVGGVLDSVVDGETGALYRGDASVDLATVLSAFDPTRYDAGASRRNAEKFGPERFRSEFLAALRAYLRPSEPP